MCVHGVCMKNFTKKVATVWQGVFLPDRRILVAWSSFQLDRLYCSMSAAGQGQQQHNQLWKVYAGSWRLCSLRLSNLPPCFYNAVVSYLLNVFFTDTVSKWKHTTDKDSWNSPKNWLLCTTRLGMRCVCVRHSEPNTSHFWHSMYHSNKEILKPWGQSLKLE